MTGRPVRVLLVDDHAVVREGYRTLLEKHEGLNVVGEAANAAAAYQRYKDLRPDVVIMDISMPGRGGIDAIEHIRKFDAEARILVFTMHSGALAPAPRVMAPRAARPIFSSARCGASRMARLRSAPKSARRWRSIGFMRKGTGSRDCPRASSKSFA